MTDSPTLSRRVRTGRPKTEDVINVSSRWVDDRHRIIATLSDAEIVVWLGLFGELPVRLSAERRIAVAEKSHATAYQHAADKCELVHRANEERKLEAFLSGYPPQKTIPLHRRQFLFRRAQRSRLEGVSA